MADLLEHRSRFPILERTAYLVSHSLGAMPDQTSDQLAAFAEAWATRGVQAWSEGWWELPITVGNELATIIGATQDTVAMLPNVTLAEAVVASSVPLSEDRRRILIAKPDFPSVQYLWHGLPGAEVVMVGSDEETLDTQVVTEAIDERTALVVVSHVLFRTGFIVDVEPIVEAAHQMGARVVLDCYHSAGTVPLSLAALQTDFAVGGSVKWLCGGPGAGWLYVRPDLHAELEPWLVGWQADEEPFAFRPGPVRHAPGIRRFLNGTPSVPALYGARAGYRIISEVGVEAIREKSLLMTQAIIDIADELEIDVTSVRDPEHRGGMVTLGVPDEGTVAQALCDSGVILDSRPGSGIRVGPHFYNSEEDLERLRKELVRLLG